MELLDVLRDEDFDAWLPLTADEPRAYARAVVTLCQAVRRLQRPRAYIADLESVKEDEDRRPTLLRALWHEGRDLLMAELQEREVRVIDPGTIRQIARLCEPLHERAKDFQEPLARVLIKDGCIEELWLPRYEVRLKRHNSLVKFAEEAGVAVRYWSVVREFVPRRQ